MRDRREHTVLTLEAGIAHTEIDAKVLVATVRSVSLKLGRRVTGRGSSVFPRSPQDAALIHEEVL
jgi:hypothetical protein